MTATPLEVERVIQQETEEMISGFSRLSISPAPRLPIVERYKFFVVVDVVSFVLLYK